MNKAPCVVVFDLDDTLYFESDYRDSGFAAVADFVSTIYGINRQLLAIEIAKGGDVLGRITDLIGIIDIKESLLWVYRLHAPKISLHENAHNLLMVLRKKNIQVIILTDGRSISQRLKIKSLGLEKYPSYISDEHDGITKPDKGRFLEIQKKFPASRYIYVGDNLDKDFVAPNELGWLSLGLLPSPKFIHKNVVDEYPKNHLPSFWIKDICDVEKYIC